MTDASPSAGRREWLLHFLTAGIAATLGAFLYPIVRFLWPRRVTTSGEMSAVAPYRAHDLHPDAEGQWPRPFNFGGRPCLVIRTPTGEVRAFNALCTHTDCTVQYLPDKEQIFCGCHNGVYDLKGRNISGPPPRPLESYKVVLQGKPGQEEIIVSRT